MANSELQGKTFDIPENLKKHLKKIFNAYMGAKNIEGYKRLEELVNKDSVSYEQLKLIKNFFDNYSGNRKGTTYLLNGGTIMKNWVDLSLNNAREGVKNIKKSMDNIGMTSNSDLKNLPSIKMDNKKHDTDTNKILRQEGIYNMRLMENLITIIDKNKKLCLDQHN
jgi:phosphorylcholine metabolism protein LicD